MSDVFYKTQKKNQEMRRKHQVQCKMVLKRK